MDRSIEKIGSLNLSHAFGYAGTSIVFADADHAAYACGNAIRFIKLDGKVHNSLKGEGLAVGALSFSISHRVFAYSDVCMDPQIFVNSYPDCKLLTKLNNSAKVEVVDMNFSACGNYLVVLAGAPDYTVSVFEWRINSQPVVQRNVAEAPTTSITFNPLNWKQICSTGRGNVNFWRLEKALDQYSLEYVRAIPPNFGVKPGGTEHHIDGPKAHVWSDITAVIVSCANGLLCRYDISNCEASPKPVMLLPDDVSNESGEQTCEEVKKNGTFGNMSADFILISNPTIILVGHDGIVRFLDANNEFALTKQLELGADATSASFSPDYGYIVFGTSIGTIYCMNVRKCSISPVAEYHCRAITGLALSGNECVATTSLDGSVRIWSFHSKNLVARWDCTDSDALTALATVPNANLLVVGCSKGFVRIFQLDTDIDIVDTEEADKSLIYRLKLISSLRLFTSAISLMEFDSKFSFLIVGSDDGHMYVLRPRDQFRSVGFVPVDGQIENAVFQDLDSRGVLVSVLSRQDDKTSTLLTQVQLPESDSMKSVNSGDASYMSSLAASDVTEKTLLLIPDSITARRVFIMKTPTWGLVPKFIESSKSEEDAFYMIGADKQLKLFILPPAAPPPPAGLQSRSIPPTPLSPVDTWKSHSKTGGGTLALAPHHEWLISSGPDGNLQVRLTSVPFFRIEVTAAHSYKCGGCTHVIFSQDCSRVISAGQDGAFNVWTWDFTSRGKKEVNAAVAIINRLESVNEVNISRLRDWVNKMPKIDDVKETATFFQKSCTALQLSKDLKYNGAIANLRYKICDLREQLTRMIDENERKPKIEQLNRDEFTLDFEQRDNCKAEGAAKVAAVRAEIELQDLARIYEAHLVREQCWESMHVVGKTLKGFAGGLEVANYPLPIRSSEQNEVIERVKMMRHLEISEANARKSALGVDQEDFAEEPEDDDDEGIAVEPTISAAAGGSNRGVGAGGTANAETGEGTDDQSEDPKLLEIKKLLYAPFAINTQQRKRNQITLLLAIVLCAKKEFNRHFDVVMDLKKGEIEKVQEKNTRIRSIVSELGINENIFDAQIDDQEQPEKLLVVEDSEISVKRYISAEERALIEEAERLARERAAHEMEDNAKERALQDMMGGHSEGQKEIDYSKDFEQPQWITEKLSAVVVELTEEEQRFVKDWERKRDQFEEDKMRHRKALEAELRKLQASINESCAAFDEKLTVLFRRKIKSVQYVYRQELMILKLCGAILEEESIEEQMVELSLQMEKKKFEKVRSSQSLIELQKDVNLLKENYEGMVQDDRLLDRAFKREFSEYDVNIDVLYKLFKRRARGKDGGGTMRHINVSDHFRSQSYSQLGGSMSSSGDHDHDPAHVMLGSTHPVTRDLDPAVDMPQGLDEAIWDKLVEVRAQKIASENALRVRGATLGDKNLYLARRIAEDERLSNEMEDFFREMKELKDKVYKVTMDVEVDMVLKQGQDEVQQRTLPVTDYTDAILCHRSVVVELNSIIHALGNAKVEFLREIMDFKKGIHLLEWENTKCEMEAEDLIAKTRDIQLLRVTKNLQELIKGEDEERQAAEVAMLEKRLGHSLASHERKLVEKRKLLQRTRRMIKQKVAESSALEEQLAELEVSVTERRLIHDVQLMHTATNGPEQRLHDITKRRKLVDMARMQAEEIGALREEVERLRMRTFPAFSSAVQ